jgi:malonyl-CoA/methylmalonyl-CoA synthetase
MTDRKCRADAVVQDVAKFSAEIRFYSFRIPVMRVESNLQDLPYISEACVFAAPDPDATELCAAVARLRENNPQGQRNILSRIRADLSKVLPSYMLPIVIRILKDGEEVPKTQSGKTVRRFVWKTFFENADWRSVENPPPGFQYYGNMPPGIAAKNGP